MQTHEQIVESGARAWKLHGVGRYFRLLDTQEAVNVRFFKHMRVVAVANGVEAGYWSLPDGGFDAVEIEASNNPQRVKVGISDGTAGYDRYTGEVKIAPAKSVVNTGLVMVAATATPVMVSDDKRKGFRVLNSGANVVYLGGGGVSLANGCLKLNPGDLWVESEAAGAAWFAVADGGPGAIKIQELMG